MRTLKMHPNERLYRCWMPRWETLPESPFVVNQTTDDWNEVTCMKCNKNNERRISLTQSLQNMNS